jgi:hypothetical protein
MALPGELRYRRAIVPSASSAETCVPHNARAQRPGEHREPPVRWLLGSGRRNFANEETSTTAVPVPATRGAVPTRSRRVVISRSGNGSSGPIPAPAASPVGSRSMRSQYVRARRRWAGRAVGEPEADGHQAEADHGGG